MLAYISGAGSTTPPVTAGSATPGFPAYVAEQNPMAIVETDELRDGRQVHVRVVCEDVLGVRMVPGLIGIAEVKVRLWSGISSDSTAWDFSLLAGESSNKVRIYIQSPVLP